MGPTSWDGVSTRSPSVVILSTSRQGFLTSCRSSAIGSSCARLDQGHEQALVTDPVPC